MPNSTVLRMQEGGNKERKHKSKAGKNLKTVSLTCFGVYLVWTVFEHEYVIVKDKKTSYVVSVVITHQHQCSSAKTLKW